MQDELKELLIKKAKGFYYTEEQIEFVDTGESDIVLESDLSNGIVFSGRKRKQKKKANAVTCLSGFENLGVECKEKKGEDNANSQTAPVVKRKITTHYVPPDMLAIKMLFENFGQKIELFENLSDEDLVAMKNEIAKSILEEE